MGQAINGAILVVIHTFSECGLISARNALASRNKRVQGNSIMSETIHSNPDFNDDDMPAEIDFTKAEVGKFYRPNASFHIPLYLDHAVQKWLMEKAASKGVTAAEIANDLLKREIDIIESMK